MNRAEPPFPPFSKTGLPIAGERPTDGALPAGTVQRAPVLEVFASFQGEGSYVGEPQVFLRLYGCPLRCVWCDTPHSWEIPSRPEARVSAALPTAAATGSRRVERRREEGWATPFQAATWIAAADPHGRRTVSVTGGEPLLWPAFLRELGTFVGRRRLHLETAGAHPAALGEVLDVFDHVSLDLKLPSDLDSPVPVPVPEPEPVPTTEKDWATARVRCLQLVRGRDACGKLVVSGGRDATAYEPLLDDVARHAPDLPVYVQPVSPRKGIAAPTFAELEAVVEEALDRELDVRVVPQVHRQLSIP